MSDDTIPSNSVQVLAMLERRGVITTAPEEAEECCGQKRDVDGFCQHRQGHPIYVALPEREFLEASVAVWREVDRLTADGADYPGIPMDTDLRKREREAWNAYRDALDSA